MDGVEVTHVVGEGVVPVELVGDDVLALMRRLLPPQAHGRRAHVGDAQVGGLARHALLGLHLGKNKNNC